MEQKAKLAYDAQKFVLYMLLGLIYVSFICMQLGQIQAITDYSFSLHEMFFIPANITIFVGPVLFLMYIVLLIRYLKVRERKRPSQKAVVKFAGVLLSLIVIGGVIVYQFGAVHTAGFFTVEQKFENNGDYYIYLADTQIKVSKEEYDFVEPGQEYYIRYNWHELTPDKGKIQSIEDAQ